MKGHKLLIESLHDAKAICSCEKWSLTFTGLRTREQLRQEHNHHLRFVKMFVAKDPRP
jgi:hypothetical protein